MGSVASTPSHTSVQVDQEVNKIVDVEMLNMSGI
jgi:hypothetical protein